MTVRKATLEDCDSVLEWRNDPVAREASRSKDVIALDDHRAWFLKAIEGSSILILIGEVKGVRIGFVKFEYSSDRRHAEVSICLKPSERGRGQGLQLLEMSIKSYTADRQIELVATIGLGNVASRKIFRSAGFIEIPLCKDWVGLVHSPPNVLFTPVHPSDADILYKLLTSRKYQISHE
jgi:UDP-2,4-diacetamido-2,4,6-trideoxy-beta-L-altropyranose hydrolase